jgi:DNA replication protein DnaC
MGYDGKVLRRAAARYDEDKQRREELFRARQRECYAKSPRIEEIDRALSHTMAKIIASGFRRGADPRSAIEALREENLALQAERGELLTSIGYPPDALEPKPNCPLCNDHGWRGTEMCSCLKSYYVREQNAELSQLLDLAGQSFETFNFDYYPRECQSGKNLSPYQRMEKNFDICRDYAYEFSERSGNLLLSGSPGLGKTFLSASIARVVSDAGHSVVYDTAGHIFSRFESQKFERGEGEEDAEDDVARYLKCDLLIIDDLGSEMTTTFVQSALYQIVNTRLMSKRKTVISTNLPPSDLGKRYGAPVLSRIEGEYTILPFSGEDIRKLKRK